MGIVPGTFALATFHRPENVDDPVRLATLLRELAGLDLPVVFPVHPRTRDRIQAFGLDSGMGRVSLVDPVDYATFLSLAAECAFLLSDSGGVQEEASVVKRPALILRSACDRPEVLGTFTTLVTDLADLPRAVRYLLDDLPDTHRRLARMPTPYGDGLASARCVSRIASLALASS
jgi:UDP-N-acetylglucosamine 2-epimerase (non-hydrolysing)